MAELRVDRMDTANGIGGGIIVYIRDGLVVRPETVENNFNQFCKFQVKQKNK